MDVSGWTVSGMEEKLSPTPSICSVVNSPENQGVSTLLPIRNSEKMANTVMNVLKKTQDFLLRRRFLDRERRLLYCVSSIRSSPASPGKQKSLLNSSYCTEQKRFVL